MKAGGVKLYLVWDLQNWVGGMKYRIPSVGLIVKRPDGSLDAVAMVRICHGNECKDDELGVLVWSNIGEKFRVGDKWEYNIKDTK